MLRKAILRASAISLILAISLLALPTPAYAHLPGQPSFLKVNESFVDYYPVRQQSSQGIDIPQSTDINRHLPGEMIRFDIDRTLLAVSNDEADRMTFDWEFGDGAQAEGAGTEHAYTQPGSYILRIHGTPPEGQRRLIESTAMFILPTKEFQRPRIYIAVNGKEVRNDTETVPIKAGQTVRLSARLSPSSSQADAFRWDLGDGTNATGQTIEHTFQQDYRTAYVIARATVDGVYFADNAAQLANPDAASSTGGPAAWYAAAKQSMETGLREVFGGGGTNYGLAILILLFAILAGAFHSLTPGHGKTVLAALLIGKQDGKYKDLAILAASITIAHTLVIYIVGFVLLGLGASRSANSLLPYFEKASALLVFMLAVYLLATGLRKWTAARRHTAAHGHGKEHDHGHGHGHAQHHRKLSAFIARLKDRGPTWSLVIAGTGGGIVPCMDALSLMLLAAGLGHPGFGLILVLFFSLGLAATISALGLMLLAGKRRLLPTGRHEQIVSIAAPIVSGCIILVLAVLLLV